MLGGDYNELNTLLNCEEQSVRQAGYVLDVYSWLKWTHFLTIRDGVTECIF